VIFNTKSGFYFIKKRCGKELPSRANASIFWVLCEKTSTFAGISAAKAATHGMKVFRTGAFSPKEASM
jgi:hypothetical protein